MRVVILRAAFPSSRATFHFLRASSLPLRATFHLYERVLRPVVLIHKKTPPNLIGGAIIHIKVKLLLHP